MLISMLPLPTLTTRTKTGGDIIEEKAHITPDNFADEVINDVKNLKPARMKHNISSMSQL